MNLTKAFTLLYILVLRDCNGERTHRQPEDYRGRYSQQESRPISTSSNSRLGKEAEATIKSVTESVRLNPDKSSKVLEYSSDHLDVQINLRVLPKSSTSVDVTYDAVVHRHHRDHLREADFQIKRTGMKIIYRPFGSILESEVILVMETADSNESFNMSKNHIIEELLPNNGYIFCFSIVILNENSQIIKNVVNEVTLNNYPEEELQLQENPEEYFPNVLRHDPTADRRIPIPVLSGFPLVQNDEPSYNPFTRTSLRNPQGGTPERKANIAYTSTGELIHLPSSAWSPFIRRTKRSFLSSKEDEKSCVEIFLKSDPPITLDLISLLIISIAILGCAILVIIAIVVLIKFLPCCKHSKQSNVVNANHNEQMEDGECSHNETNVSDIQIGEDVKENKKIDIENEKEREFSQDEKFRKICCNNNNQNQNKSHESRDKFLTFPNKITKFPMEAVEENFHPGYEIPPTSMVEVYGYDFPRPTKRCLADLSLSSSPSSCELNDQVTDFAWDLISNKYNLDIPGRLNKKSDVNKQINKFETIHTSSNCMPIEDSIPLNRKKRPRPPSFQAFQKSEAVHDNDSKHTPHCIEDKECSPKLINTFQYYSKRGNSIDLSNSSSSAEFRKQSIGDVTVSGGTLIEVPEGYASPVAPISVKESAVLRIFIS